MTEEEKKAIEKLSSKQNETTWVDTIRQIKREEINDAVITRQKYITTLLNLIQKQQKEIEELKNKIAKRQWVKVKENGEVEPLFYISKDKIRDKIKELEKEKDLYFEKQIMQGKIDLLKELLEE